jgi:hypothetical protein
MENIKEIPSSPLDFFLLPVWVHKKISTRIRSVILAFAFVGLFDMFFFRNILTAGIIKGSSSELFYRCVVFILFSVIVGIVDVVCTMVPIGEFAVLIGRRSQRYVSPRMPVILMNSYALSHLIFIVPWFVYIYSGVNWDMVGASSSGSQRLILSVLIVLMNFLPYVQLGIIYRTFSVKTRIKAFGKFMLILISYYWIRISSGAVYYVAGLFHKLLKSM